MARVWVSELTDAAKDHLADKGYDPTSALDRCVERFSAWSRIRCRRSSSTRSSEAGEIIIVDVEPNDDQPGELQIVFRAIEGFEPPTAPEPKRRWRVATPSSRR